MLQKKVKNHLVFWHERAVWIHAPDGSWARHSKVKSDLHLIKDIRFESGRSDTGDLGPMSWTAWTKYVKMHLGITVPREAKPQ